MRRLAVALVSLVALAVGATVAVGSTSGVGRAHAATVHPRSATGQPFATTVRAHPMAPMPLALLRALKRLERPLHPQATTLTAPLQPGVGGGTCYVAAGQCSIRPCAQFVSPGPPARVGLAMASAAVTSAPQAARTHCHRTSGPSVNEPVGGVRIAPDTSAVAIVRSVTAVTKTR